MIQTVVVAQDSSKPIHEGLYRRQWPGVWPGGSSMVGETLFLPPSSDGKLRADWLICGTPPPNQIVTDIPKERRIFLLQEPPEVWTPTTEFLEHFGYVISPYTLPTPKGTHLFLGVTTGLFWWYGAKMHGHKETSESLTFDDIKSETPSVKNKLLSTIVSNKSFLPGHQSRITFTLALKEELGDDFDVFGYPHNPIADKRDALVGYKFHLAIENSIHPHYWTEKLADPILGRCKTFYHGASEIHQYFDNSAVVPIDIYDLNNAIDTIKNHLSLADKIDYESIEKSRGDILNKFNFPFFIDKVIRGIIQGAA